MNGHHLPGSQDEETRIMEKIATPIPVKLTLNPETNKSNLYDPKSSAPQLHHIKENLPDDQI